MYRARIAIFFLLILSIFSCVSTGDGSLSTSSLIPVKEITTVENAKRALVIAQDFRMSALKIARKGTQEQKEKFETYDKMFRFSWASANKLLKAWEKSENEQRLLADTSLRRSIQVDSFNYKEDFKRLYTDIILHAVDLEQVINEHT